MQETVSSIDFCVRAFCQIISSIIVFTIVCDGYRFYNYSIKSKRYSDKKASADGADLGEPQSLEGDGDVSSRDIKERIFASQSYMASQIKLGTIDPELLRTCRNSEERCTYWR